MATVIKTKRTRYYLASYRDRDGKQHLRSTRVEHSPDGKDEDERRENAATNKRLALKMALDWEELERGNPTEAVLRKTFEEMSKRLLPEKLEFAKTAAFLREWLKNKGASEGTRKRYKKTIESFIDSLGAKAAGPIANIQVRDINAYVQARLAEGLASSTVTTDIKALSTAFNSAVRQSLILTNPVPAAEAIENTSEAREPFTKDELEAMLKEASEDWKTVILLGAYAGLRLGDARSLKWNNVDLMEKVLRLRPQKTARKKQDLVIPLHPALEKHLTALPSADDPEAPVSPSLSELKIGGINGISRRFMEIANAAGIEQNTVAAEVLKDGTKSKGRKFNRKTFHSLRHFFISQLEAAEVAPDLRMKLSGHADTKSHARYTHTELETLKKAVARI